MEPDDDKTQTHIVLTKGTMVSHYRIIEKIGAGGMGEVYLALDTKLNRKVALKFLPPHLCQDEDCRKRFKREAQAAAGLDHPNIAAIYEVGEFQSRPFYAMQIVEGQSLKDVIAGKDLPIDRILEIGIQVCEGLQAAHDKGIIHRDIKPSNILLDQHGRVRIVDFGLAAIRGSEHLTKTGSTLGTIGYMSPEQVRGKEIDQRSDLFSLGVVFYELITKQNPFKRDSEAATLKAVSDDLPQPLARFKSGLPDGLQPIIDKALEKYVKTRYQHADGMLSDLMRLKRDSDSTMSTRPAARTPIRLLRVFLPIFLVVLTVAVLVLKPWRIDVSPTQEVIATENRLAIMYFDNLVDPEDNDRVARMITSLLITDLSESQYLQVVSRQRLYDILKLLGKEDLKAIDRTVATQVAEKAGVKWILTGDIMRVEPNIILTSDISDAASGEILATQRVTGETGEDLFAVVDKLSAAVREDLSLPAVAQDEPDRPVADVTTHSPEAYRYYLEGLDYREKVYYTEALSSFREALKLDSTFAMAYYWVAGLAPSEEEKRQAMAQALEYSDRVSEKERWYIEALDALLSGQTKECIRRLERIVEHYPEEKEALLWLGDTYDDVFQFDEAIRCLKRAIEIDPLFKEAICLLAYRYQDIGDYEQALWAINKYIELVPDEANPYDSRGEIYTINGQLDKAIESFQKALEIKPDFWRSARSLGNIHVLRGDYSKAESLYHVRASHVDATQRGWGRIDLVRILLHQGKFQEALRRLNLGIETDRIELGDCWPLVEKIDQRYAILAWFVNDYPAALAEAERLKTVVDRLDPYNRNQIQLYLWRGASVYAASGNPTKADSLMQQMVREVDTTGTDSLANNYLFYLAYVEYEKGNFDSAIVLLKRVTGRQPASIFLRDLGLYYLRAGRLGDAVSTLEKCLGRYDRINLENPNWYVITHYWLAQAYEETGWVDKAIEQYETFLDIWKNADEGLESVEDAKRRLARLRESI